MINELPKGFAETTMVKRQQGCRRPASLKIFVFDRLRASEAVYDTLGRLRSRGTASRVELGGGVVLAGCHLSTEQRQALRLLVCAPRGLAEATLVNAYGLKSDLLTGLVDLHFAEVVTGTAAAGAGSIDIARVRITNAGRRALGDALDR
jgi:hypothetical protein